MKARIGIIGLGVMGHNLAINIERNGFPAAGYDVDSGKTRSFMARAAQGKRLSGADSLEALVTSLEKPRTILLMVPAGAPVDHAIQGLKPYLEPGDILLDGGNSYFQDTERRSQDLESSGIHFLGTGISGGEEGALWGPSLMPGGRFEAWQTVAPILSTIAAKAEDGSPCVAYMGPGGAGHYVKMVHNGIEYADMQLIAESYDILRRVLGLTALEISTLFAEWNKGELKSYLIEITSDILQAKDVETGLPLVDLILDEAQQKGTGKWASQNSLDIGAPIPTINAAVESRILSSLKAQRVQASRLIRGSNISFIGNKQNLVDAIHDSLVASKITAYAQGMAMLRLASEEYRYELNLGDIAGIWRAGCVIRASLLNDIMACYQKDPALSNLLFDETIRGRVESQQEGWRKTIQTAVGVGVPVLALGSALAYFDAFRSERLPANLIQAQRDYFGAHTYRRIDREGVFHTDWAAKK